MKIYKPDEIVQQSPEWFAVRKLKLTASKAQQIGNNGKGLVTYVKEIMSEYFSSAEKIRFSNDHTDRGNELEEQGRAVYELETGNVPKTVGFIEVSEHVGCSPDSLVGEDGLLEMKCPMDEVYYGLLLNGANEIDTKYIWQCQMQMLLTERKWCDLTFYNPNFKKNLLIFRLLPDLQKQEELRVGIETGIRLIKEHLEVIENLPLETKPIIIGEAPQEETVMVYEGNKKVGEMKLPKVYSKSKARK